MSMKKAKIDGAIVEVLDLDELSKISNPVYGYTAVIIDDCVYPLRAKNDTRPGIIKRGNLIYQATRPSEEDIPNYSVDNVIDFGASTSMRDLLSKHQALREAEKSIITTVDDITKPIIRENDSPEMVALKKAISAKAINLDKYESRFGPNYNNDKRLLDKSSITLKKLKEMCTNLDINATITLKDANPDVPNPMREEITVSLTEEGGYIYDED